MKTIFKFNPAFYTILLTFALFISLSFSYRLSAQSNKGYSFNSTKFLKENKGQKLTEGDFEWYSFMYEFLLGSPLANGDKQYLRNDILEEFN